MVPEGSTVPDRDDPAGRRERKADDRDAAADARDRLAHRRERKADERDAAADARDRLADGREREADDRDVAADSRDRLADRRERKADERDVAADAREVALADREAGVASSLVAFAQALAGCPTVEAMAEVVARAVRELVDADGATFVLRDGDECHYVDDAAVAPLWKGRRFPVDSCISGWAMTHRATAVIEDIELDDRIPQDLYRPTFVKSLVMTPIRAQDPIGAIGAYWARPRQPSARETWVLGALADSAALAVEHLLLHDELEARVAERTAELSAATEDLRLFRAGVAHELRTPVLALRTLTELLATSFGHELGDGARTLATAVDRTATELDTLVTAIMDFAGVDEAEPVCSEVPVAELVERVRARLAGVVASTGAVVEWDTVETIVADPVQMDQLLHNLIDNAIGYMPPGRPPAVRVAIADTGTEWELTVADNGPGIPAAERANVLLPFRRGSTSGTRTGSGLGLAICTRIVHAHRGTLHIGDHPDGGTEIVVRLPKRSARR